MEQDKRVEDKKARFILLITQVVLWFMVMVMEMVVLIVKQINVSEHMLFLVSINLIATVYKGNIIKNLIMDCQSYTKYRPNETTGGIFVSWRRKEELPTGA